MGSLAGSVLLHLGTAALIFIFAHRFWPGPVPHDGLAPAAQDGGTRQSGIPVKSRMNLHPRSDRARPGWVLAPTPAGLAFPPGKMARRTTEFSMVPDRQGAGLHGGYGMGYLPEEGGFVPGSRPGYTSPYLSCGFRPDRQPWSILQSDHVVIVLDLSGSTRERAATRATVMKELRESLGSLRQGADFNVVCFARQTAVFAGACIRVAPENIAGALAFVEALHQDPGALLDPEDNVPEGSSGTSRMDAGLLAAIKGGADEILLVSDGNTVAREGGRGLSQREILARLHRAVPEDESDPIIHTVCVQPQGSGFLRQVAEEFTGKYRQ